MKEKTLYSKLIGKSTVLLFLVWLLFCVIGCVDNKYIVDDNRDKFHSDKEYIIYFMPRLESNFSTRSLSPFPQYCKAQIYAFSSGGNQQSIKSPVYRSQAAGTLAPTNEPMMLTDGEYDFYAISIKEDSLPPAFTSNVATQLSNGKDYLWYGVQSIVIDQNGITIPITFQHVASQIVINVENKDSINPMKNINRAVYNPPVITDSVKWNLLSGVITPATSLSPTQIDMIVDSFTTYCIMVPVDVSHQTMSYVATIEQESGQLQKCAVSLPLPDNGYQAGHSYEYLMYFDADTLSLGLVTVSAWKEDVVSSDVQAN